MVGQKRDALTEFLDGRSDLIALAQAIVKNRAVAEELVQDSWISWSGKSYPDDKARPIFKRIVLNLAKDWYRKQKTEKIRMDAYALLYDDAPDTERVCIARQDLMNVLFALQKLPPKALRAFRLSRVEGLTYAEIADHMGIATSTAYGLVADALVHLTLAAHK